MKFSTILNVCCALIVFLFATTTTFAQLAETVDGAQVSSATTLDLQEDFGDVNYVFNAADLVPFSNTMTGGVWCPADQSFWITNWTADTIWRADWNGNFIEKFQVPAAAAQARSLTWDGTNIWVGNASTTIASLDVVTKQVVSTVTVPENARFLTYDPDANMGAGGFWLGNWSTDIYQVDMSGNTLTQLTAANYASITSRYGAAYDNISPGGPFLWLYNQNGVPSTAVASKVHIASGAIVDEYDFDGPFQGGFLAGGLFITDTLYTGTPMLNGFLQGAGLVGIDLLDTNFVDFSVDMTPYGSSFTQVYVSGNFNGWSGDANPMTDNGDGTWSLTLPIFVDSLEWKFTIDNWTDQEQFMSGMPCTITDPSGQFVNRFLEVTGDVTLPTYCWNTCTDVCAIDYNVTFNVNMDSAPDSIKNNFTQAYVSGNFNGWSGDANPMTDNGDGTWSVTLPISVVDTNHLEWKFTVDNWTSQEEFMAGMACTITDGSGQFTNRYYPVTADVTLPVFCWSACSECLSSTNTLNIDENLFKLNPSLVRDFTNITFSDDVINQDKQVFVYNTVGQLVENVTVNNQAIYRLETANLANGLYFVTVKTETAMLTQKFVVNK